MHICNLSAIYSQTFMYRYMNMRLLHTGGFSRRSSWHLLDRMYYIGLLHCIVLYKRRNLFTTLCVIRSRTVRKLNGKFRSGYSCYHAVVFSVKGVTSARDLLSSGQVHQYNSISACIEWAKNWIAATRVGLRLQRPSVSQPWRFVPNFKFCFRAPGSDCPSIRPSHS